MTSVSCRRPLRLCYCPTCEEGERSHRSRSRRRLRRRCFRRRSRRRFRRRFPRRFRCTAWPRSCRLRRGHCSRCRDHCRRCRGRFCRRRRPASLQTAQEISPPRPTPRLFQLPENAPPALLQQTLPPLVNDTFPLHCGRCAVLTTATFLCMCPPTPSGRSFRAGAYLPRRQRLWL